LVPYFTNRPGRPDGSMIVPELLVGAYPEPADLAWLAAERGVRAVLNLQDDFDLAAKRLTLLDLEIACAAADVHFARIPIADGDAEGLALRLPGAVALLARLVHEHGVTYLHCNAGMNRAPTVAVAYLHAHHGMAIPDAVRHVKARRSCLPYMAALEAAYPARPSLRPRTS
jgi:protein-tyrosine phosphatase